MHQTGSTIDKKENYLWWSLKKLVGLDCRFYDKTLKLTQLQTLLLECSGQYRDLFNKSQMKSNQPLRYENITI